MGPVSAELAIDAPRRRVFDFVGDLGNRPAFTDHFISDFRLSRVESSGVGAGARFRLFAPPRAIWMDTVIEALEPPHRISERGSGGRFNRIPAATEWEFTEGPGSLTTVRVVYWTEPGHPIDRAKEVLGAASIWYSRDWTAALRRLRDQLESDPGERRRIEVAGGNRHPTGIP
ncbi:MAG: SRPBCC family protein [Actinomycetota bacterium]